MSDILSRLEDEMEVLFDDRRDQISRARQVTDWADYQYRAGFLDAIREVGRMLKKIRNPAAGDETGEIPGIFDTEAKIDTTRT